MEDVDEDEDEEGVVVFENVSCAAMRAGAAERMEGMSSGRGLEAGGWGGLAVTWRPGGQIRSAAVGEGGAGLRSPPSGLGCAGLLQCARACGLVSTGGNSSRGLHSGARGFRPGVSGVCAGGLCGSLGVVGVPWGVGLPAAGVCGLLGVEGGEGCLAGGSVAGVCGCLGGWGRPVSQGPGPARDGWRAWATGWGVGTEGQGWGLCGRCGAWVACVVSACSGTPVWSLVGLAVWR